MASSSIVVVVRKMFENVDWQQNLSDLKNRWTNSLDLQQHNTVIWSFSSQYIYTFDLFSQKSTVQAFSHKKTKKKHIKNETVIN